MGLAALYATGLISMEKNFWLSPKNGPQRFTCEGVGSQRSGLIEGWKDLKSWPPSGQPQNTCNLGLSSQLTHDNGVLSVQSLFVYLCTFGALYLSHTPRRRAFTASYLPSPHTTIYNLQETYSSTLDPPL